MAFLNAASKEVGEVVCYIKTIFVLLCIYHLAWNKDFYSINVFIEMYVVHTLDGFFLYYTG